MVKKMLRYKDWKIINKDGDKNVVKMQLFDKK
jgi:hypothetical protein